MKEGAKELGHLESVVLSRGLLIGRCGIEKLKNHARTKTNIPPLPRKKAMTSSELRPLIAYPQRRCMKSIRGQSLLKMSSRKPSMVGVG